LGPKAEKPAKKDKTAAVPTPPVAPAPTPAPIVTAAAEPAAPAEAPAAAAAATSSGDWSVQLAAPRSEGEAQSTIARLKSKYGSALGDSELGVHKANVNGETVYRVRVSGMSKADAAALCGKVKASGGECFLAK
jgi:cell division protein FtsN